MRNCSAILDSRGEVQKIKNELLLWLNLNGMKKRIYLIKKKWNLSMNEKDNFRILVSENKES